MTLPRKPPIEPLQPPPDRFDEVFRAARGRRHHRAASVLGVSAVFLAGLGGGMSLEDGVSTVPQAVVSLASDLGADAERVVAGSEDEPASESTSASRTPTGAATKTGDPPMRAKERARPTVDPATVALAPPVITAKAPRGVLAVHGKAVDESGDPLPGLYVYAGEPRSDVFLPLAEPVGVTDAKGRFSLPCPKSPVLLTTWPLNVETGQPASGSDWAATFVGGATNPRSAEVADCHRDRQRSIVRLLPGSTVEGTAEIGDTCQGVGSVGVQLFGNPATTVRLAEVSDGAAFRIAGLPPGEHVLLIDGQRVSLDLRVGQTVEQNLSSTCGDPTPVPTTTPVPTKSPTPNPSPTPTPTVTPSPTSTPAPSPTGGSMSPTPAPPASVAGH